MNWFLGFNFFLFFLFKETLPRFLSINGDTRSATFALKYKKKKKIDTKNPCLEKISLLSIAAKRIFEINIEKIPSM